jgi:hypothetical protein
VPRLMREPFPGFDKLQLLSAAASSLFFNFVAIRHTVGLIRDWDLVAKEPMTVAVWPLTYLFTQVLFRLFRRRAAVPSRGRNWFFLP